MSDVCLPGGLNGELPESDYRCNDGGPDCMPWTAYLTGADKAKSSSRYRRLIPYRYLVAVYGCPVTRPILSPPEEILCTGERVSGCPLSKLGPVSGYRARDGTMLYMLRLHGRPRKSPFLTWIYPRPCRRWVSCSNSSSCDDP